MVKKFLLLFLFTLSLLFSQQTSKQAYLESLANSFQASMQQDDHNLAIKLLDRLVYAYAKRDTSRAVQYIAEAQKLAKGHDKLDFVAYSKLMQGYFTSAKPGNAKQALDYFIEARDLAAEAGNDTLHTFCIIKSGESHIAVGQFEEAEKLLKEGIQKAQAQNRKADEAYAYDRLGMAYGVQKKHEESVKAGDEAVRIAREEGLEKELLVYIKDRGIALYYLGKQQEVAKSLLEVAKIEEALGDSAELARTLSNLQVVLNEVEDFSTAAQYGRKSLEMLKHIQLKPIEAATMANLATSYRYMKRNDSALIFNRQAIELSHELNMHGREAILYGNMLGILVDMDSVEATEEVIQKFLSLREEHPEIKQPTTVSLTYVGQFYAEQGRFKEALPFLEESNTFLQQRKEASALSKNSTALAITYASLGKYKEAYELQSQAHIIKDSLLDRNQVRAITKLESEYKFEREKEQQERAFEVERERASLIRTGLMIGLGLTALLLFFIYRNYYNQRKANQLLLEKNNQIEEQKTQLSRLNETKDRIFSIIGHDLRKPAISFRGIGKKVNYLLKKQDYETLNQLGSEIERDALSLNKLTDDLLSWALLQKDVMPYKPESLKAHPLIAETMALFNQVAKDKSISLENDIPQDLEVYADQNGLRSIIRNLIDNGIKFTPEGGSVSVYASKEGDGVKIMVKDSGVGIPQEKLHSIHLLRADKSEQGTSGEKGSGLGLHLVDELTRLNRGSLEILSELGNGTQVGVLLPSMKPAM